MWQKRESIHAALKEKRYDEVRDGVCQYENMLTEEQSPALAKVPGMESAVGRGVWGWQGRNYSYCGPRHWHIQ